MHVRGKLDTPCRDPAGAVNPGPATEPGLGFPACTTGAIAAPRPRRPF